MLGFLVKVVKVRGRSGDGLRPFAWWATSADRRDVGVEHLVRGGIMAEYGEWNRKGASLSDVTARKEYGVSQDFIVAGIKSGKLEYRQGAVWGNPYFRILRNQLEQYIATELGQEYLTSSKNQTALRRIKKEIADLKKRLDALQAQRTELENQMRK
jgi:hypothetical protein